MGLLRRIQQKRGKLSTDIDRVYEIVQDKGKIKITDIADKFKITKKQAEEWAQVLDEHKLAELHYPTFGGPELLKKKPEKKENE